MDDRRMTVERWIIKASRDLETARVMLEQANPPTDVVCFHSQQCAEKVLKAFLVEKNEDFPKTHDLLRLLHSCIVLDGEFRALVECATALTDYAVEPRYVDDWREIPFEEAINAVKSAEESMGFVCDKLDMKGVPA